MVLQWCHCKIFHTLRCRHLLVTVIAAAAVVLRRSRTAKPSSSDRARPTAAASCGAGVCMLAGVFASKPWHRCRGSTSPLMTALEPTHAWLARALMWWSGLTLWLALLFSCFCERGLPQEPAALLKLGLGQYATAFARWDPSLLPRGVLSLLQLGLPTIPE